MAGTGARAAQPFSIDRDAYTIRFERRVDADRAQVFEAWTTPEQVSSWWDPDGEPLVTCEIELRVGGTFSFATRSHSEMPFAGVYREIAPPDRLVFEAMGATGRVTLEDAAGGTRMLVEIACRSKEHFEQFVKLGVHEGTARTLDNLVAFANGRVSRAV